MHVEIQGPHPTQLYCERQGQGPTLVLLNGMSQTTVSWQSHVKVLRAHYDVVVYDARGQGRSALGVDRLTLDQHAEDFIALQDALGIERAHWIGFSHGARIAVRAAARWPSRVERLVLTSIGAEFTAMSRTIIRGWYEVLDRGGLEALAWSVLPTILGGAYLEGHERLLEPIVRATVARNEPEGLRALLDGLRRYTAPSVDAGAIRAPTLVMSGDSDPLVPAAQARALAAKIAGSTLAIIDNCGHTVPIEAVERWRERVMEFLSAIDFS